MLGARSTCTAARSQPRQFRSRTQCHAAGPASPAPRLRRAPLISRKARVVVLAADGPAADDEETPTGLLDRDNPLLAEKFAVIGSGQAECNSCQYLYEPSKGDENYPVPRGVRFESLPEDWRCPVCAAEKKTFVSKGVQVAGFAANQGYGFGSNSMTSENKSLLIYGALALFFGLFISGYLLE